MTEKVTLWLDLLGVLLFAAASFLGLSAVVGVWAGCLAAGVVVLGSSWLSDRRRGNG